MRSRTEPIDPAGLDLAPWLYAGDRVLVAQASGEPATLVAAARALAETRPLTFIVGMLITRGYAPAPAPARFESYGRLGRAAALPDDRTRVLRQPYSAWTAALSNGGHRADVVMVQLSPADALGRHHLGMGDLVMIDAARRARLVLAEINPDTPRTPGTLWPADLPIHLKVAAAAAPPAPADQPAGETERAIAAHVAAEVPEAAVLQFGIGRLPRAIAEALSGHRDLGLHSGVISDEVARLITCGALTGARKEFDAGRAVASTVIGGAGLRGLLDGPAPAEVQSTARTHAAAVIAGLARFTAINSAVEIDLAGRVNLELAAGREIGGLGGQPDFTRGALAAPGGRAIVALPATTGDGRSRIVARVARESLGPGAADRAVTQHGVAHLRGQPPAERARRLIAIAAPEHREALARAWHDHERAAHV
ncbi:acetyl-CoA hydrolase/transferase C-terminal domain-containing protein [Frigidibacter sp. MR17.14]|uniref:acetyl-CoA hydrolase/transferase C-terminal domain-containing protein n=1 Tax=Frigidibacter sp. MR17.14 TaxID=3126509 RepID=UPI003012B287